jgi:hypothetical protein
MKRKKPNMKARPANEITEQEINDFLVTIRNFDGYPKLRDLSKLFSSISTYKINIILRYLERSKMIIVDNDGYITWIRKNRPENMTLADVAEIEDSLKKFLARDSEN